MFISKEQAEKILKDHGINLDTLTAIDTQTKARIVGTSFLDEFGDKTSYVLEEVFIWLGY